MTRTENEQILLDALTACLGRLYWLNHPEHGNTEAAWIKVAEDALVAVGEELDK